MTDVVVTFEGVPLQGVKPRRPLIEAGTRTRLSGGHWHVQKNPRAPNTPFCETLECFTQDYSDILALEAKTAIDGRLIIEDPSTATIDLYNVAITGTIQPRWNGAGWEYEVEFTQTV